MVWTPTSEPHCPTQCLIPAVAICWHLTWPIALGERPTCGDLQIQPAAALALLEEFLVESQSLQMPVSLRQVAKFDHHLTWCGPSVKDRLWRVAVVLPLIQLLARTSDGSDRRVSGSEILATSRSQPPSWYRLFVKLFSFLFFFSVFSSFFFPSPWLLNKKTRFRVLGSGFREFGFGVLPNFGSGAEKNPH